MPGFREYRFDRQPARLEAWFPGTDKEHAHSVNYAGLVVNFADDLSLRSCDVVAGESGTPDFGMQLRCSAAETNMAISRNFKTYS